jgi:hypothetical protein
VCPPSLSSLSSVKSTPSVSHKSSDQYTPPGDTSPSALLAEDVPFMLVFVLLELEFKVEFALAFSPPSLPLRESA